MEPSFSGKRRVFHSKKAISNAMERFDIPYLVNTVMLLTLYRRGDLFCALTGFGRD